MLHSYRLSKSREKNVKNYEQVTVSFNNHLDWKNFQTLYDISSHGRKRILITFTHSELWFHMNHSFHANTLLQEEQTVLTQARAISRFIFL